MLDILHAFWDGFSRPRLIALAGIFLVALAQALLLTQPFLARVDTRYLMAGPHDYAAELTSEVMRLRESRSDGRMLIVHVGSSYSQEAIDTTESVAADLSQALGQPVHYWPLFMPVASLWEEGALIDQVPPGSHGYAVIEVNHGMMGNKRDLPERLVDQSESVLNSKFAEDALRKAGHPVRFRTGFPLIDHTGFFSARRDNLWRWMIGRPLAERMLHRFTTATVRPSDKEQGVPLDELAKDYAVRADVNSAVLEKVVALAESRGLKVILFQADARPGSLDGYPEITRNFVGHLEDAARKMNLPIIRPMSDAGLTSDDFLDRYHLWHRPARLKFQAAFVRSIGAIVKKDEQSHAS